MVDNQQVLVNGTLESRKRAQIKRGDVVQIDGQYTIQVV